MSRVLVIGAGRIGAQVGVELALHGHEVTFWARHPEAAERAVLAALELGLRAGVRPREEATEIRERVGISADLSAAATAEDVVFEAVAEDLELKGRLLGVAATASPEALLATGTSSLRVTEIGEAASAPERTVGLHYLNPPLLLPVVEVVAGERSQSRWLEAARELVVSCEKTPIEVALDVPGFAWNRLQLALIREAVALVADGVVSAEEVDAMVREGLARRWRHVGPLTAVGIGGVDTWNEIARNVLPRLSNATELPDLDAFAELRADPSALLRRRDDGLIADLSKGDG